MVSRGKLILKGELIGREVEILESTDRTRVGMKGIVVDETRNMLIIEVRGEEKMIPKAGTKFRFKVDGDVDVEGELILYRPEDRIKRARW